MSKRNSFFWYELVTPDPAAAETFYAKVVGWTPKAWEQGGYTIMNAGDHGVAGIMLIPEELKQAGGRPGWIGYILTDDVDKAAAGVKQAGGKVHRQPDDIPGIGRFAVVSDPQGAHFMLMAPQGPEQAPVAPMTPGHVGWHELYTTDWEKSFAFYESQFGWVKADAIDMGPMGKYQLFADSRDKECGAVGGMMSLPPQVPVPVWGFYFVVEALDAAVERLREAGGQVLMGPMEVPGGAWIVNGLDPQGAHFSLVAAKR